MKPARIYCEIEAKEYPAAQAILKKFKDIPCIMIEHYKDVFNRPNQSFHHQKHHQALVLAKKYGQYYYEANSRVLSFGESRLIYTDQIRNCLYDCEYCFLQGMHQSAHLVLFVNQNDYYEAVLTQLSPTNVLNVSISYVTDLLAFEPLYEWHRGWYLLAKQHKNLSIETRTKSDNAHVLFSLKPVSNFVITWSVNPSEIVRKYEHGCASLANRLYQINQALRLGWKVRLAIDPILLVSDWKSIYKQFLRDLSQTVPLGETEGISYGFFRMHPTQYEYMVKDSDSRLLRERYEKKGKTRIGYEEEERGKEYIQGILQGLYPEEKSHYVDG